MPTWPRDDNFDQTPTYGPEVCGYFRFRPTTAYAVGQLADFDGDGVPFATRTGAGSDGNPLCFAWRNLLVQDCSVRVVSYMGSTLPVLGASQIRETGVCARVGAVGAGTSTGAGDSAYVNLPSCYMFSAVGNLGTQQVTFAVKKFAGGSVSTLATITAAIDNLVDGFAPFTLRLDVWDTGGTTVNMVGYLENFSIVGAGPLAGSVAILGSTSAPVQDSSSALLGVGRCGFVLGDDEQNTSIPGLPFYRRSKVSAFRVFDYSSSTGVGNLRLGEDWVRLTPLIGNLVTSKASNQGRSSLLLFSGDQQTQGDEPVFTPAPSSADALQYQYTGTSSDRAWCMWQAPANSLTTHSPQIDIRWTTLGDQAYSRYGVIAKASGANAISGGSWLAARGYMALIDHAAGEIAVWRLNGSQSEPTKLATVGMTVSADAWYELRLVAKPLIATVEDGAQLLEVYLGGTRQTLVLESTVIAIGFSAHPDGGIIDASSERIASNPGEGLALWNAGGVGVDKDVIELRDWTEGSLGPIDDPNEQAGIDLAPESSGSLATLDTYTALLAAPIESEQGYEIHRTTFDSGHTLARLKVRLKRKRWPKLETVPLTVAQRDALIAFWRARSGSVQPFNWTNPEDEQTYTVHFIDGTLEQVELFRNVWVLSFGLEEIR